jgi:hypothetical protein
MRGLALCLRGPRHLVSEDAMNAWSVLLAAWLLCGAVYGLGAFLEAPAPAVCDTDAACAAIEGETLPALVWK